MSEFKVGDRAVAKVGRNEINVEILAVEEKSYLVRNTAGKEFHAVRLTALPDTDSPATEALFLRNESLVEHATILFCGNSKIEKLKRRETLFNKVRVKIIKNTYAATLVGGTRILRVCHIFHQIHYNAAQRRARSVNHPEKPYIFGKTAVEKLNLV